MAFNPKILLSVLAILLASGTYSFAAVIDVTTYGATGNDTTDDTAAIASAVATLTTDDTLLFPEADLYYKVAVNSNFQFRNIDKIKILIRGKILSFGTPVEGDYIFDLMYTNDIEFIGQGGGFFRRFEVAK